MDDNLKFIQHIYKTMEDEKLFLSYIGNITPEITNALLKSIKYDQTGFAGEVIVKKRVYKIIVECLENIYRHSETFDDNLPPSIFLLGKGEKSYFIITGNFVYNDQLSSIKELIDNINSLNKEGLKKKYREILSQGKISEKGGAGLGMYDIAIKSGNPLVYDFKGTESDTSLYILKIKVDI